MTPAGASEAVTGWGVGLGRGGACEMEVKFGMGGWIGCNNGAEESLVGERTRSEAEG